ncbi:outer membrane protein [Flavobacterium glycines]|uniref:Outer membrane protein n=1 Tax=Flavobacterium glycines TaxID=551990 RepID=A0A1B9DN10_9FLAO|nr:outer membrane beta-barrel protein [Flavobacterium glycines]OCB71080.1 hypothetical protein FBGL_11570 [Flavobacterium glycines]GEL10896.1 hypothetical protein FGL01_16350 [Flavobacterium glycines]SDI49738.1 outer membrane protein [Flavobacterium glycines]
MKKLFLSASLAFFGVISAQTEKGAFIISGKTGLNFTSNNVKYKLGGETDESKTNSFNISPAIGYFVANNFALGLAFDYKSTTTKQQVKTIIPIATENTKETQNILSIVPNVTYFFFKGKTKPYFGTGLGLANSKYKSNYTKNSSSEYQFSYTTKNNIGLVLTANGGILFIITPSISADLGIGYANYSPKNNGIKTSSSAFGANAGISVFLK